MLDNFHHLRILGRGYDRHTRLDDPCLLVSDVRESWAKDGRVIVADVRDHRHERLADVRRIESAAEADLQHGNVHTPAVSAESRER